MPIKITGVYPKDAMTIPSIFKQLEFDNHCVLLPNYDHLSKDHKPKLNWIYPVAIYYKFSTVDKRNVFITSNHLSTLAKNWKLRYHVHVNNFRLNFKSTENPKSKYSSSTEHLSQYREFLT